MGLDSMASHSAGNIPLIRCVESWAFWNQAYSLPTNGRFVNSQREPVLKMKCPIKSVLSANILPIMSKAQPPPQKPTIPLAKFPQYSHQGWNMAKPAPDLYAYLPKVLKTLVDDVATVGEQYSTALNEFEEYCHQQYNTDEPLASVTAWTVYTKEWTNRYSTLTNGFHTSLNQLLVRDLKARRVLLGSTEFPEGLNAHLQYWSEVMVVRLDAHLRRLH